MLLILNQIPDSETSNVLGALRVDLVDVHGARNVDLRLPIRWRVEKVHNETANDDDEGDEVEPVGGVACQEEGKGRRELATRKGRDESQQERRLTKESDTDEKPEKVGGENGKIVEDTPAEEREEGGKGKVNFGS